jgi:HK97 family phage major capsid protein
MNKFALRQRAEDIKSEVETKTAEVQSGRISKAEYRAYIDRVSKEADEIQAGLKAHDQANRYMAGSEAAMGGLGDVSGAPGGGYVHLPSPSDATPQQWKALTDAMRTGTPFRTEVMPRPSAGMSGSIAMKAYTPALESGITSSFTGTLPAIMSPYAVGMAYDPLDLASLWPAVAMPGPSATQIVHSSNTNEAAIVGEGAAKPELGPGFTVNQITPSKVAVTVSTSYEAMMDTDLYQSGSFASFLPVEAQNSYTNKRSDILLNAVSGTAGATFNGLLQTSGVLTQSATGLPPLDALSMGFVAIRNGTAKADPDLVIMSPNTLGALRRLKNAEGNYLLELLSGPLNLSAYGQPETRGPASEAGPYFREAQGTKPFNGSLWGAEIAVSTHIADGEAAVVSIKGGGGLVWVRAGLELFFNPGYGDVLFQNNLVAWRVESRLAFNVPRPSAVCLVSNLPTS